MILWLRLSEQSKKDQLSMQRLAGQLILDII